MAPTTTILSRTRVRPGTCVMAHWQSFAIVAWQASADRESVREVVNFADLLIPLYGRFSVIHVVEPTAGFPTQSGRDEFTSTIRSTGQQNLACVGVLLPEAPVTAAMLRTFVRTFRMLLRGELETVVEQSAIDLAREIVKIHEQRTTHRASAGVLIRAIAELRRISSESVGSDARL